MKKITPYIFLFIIFVNLFAPFTSDFRNKKMISFTKAEAGEDLKMSVDVSHTNDNIQLIIKLENVATLLEKIIGRSDVKLVVTAEVKKEKTGEVVYNKEVNLDCDEWALMNATCNANLKIVGLEAETKYIVKISTTIVITDIPTIGPPKISYGKVTPNMITTGSATLNSNGEIVITTNKEEDTKKKVDTKKPGTYWTYALKVDGKESRVKSSVNTEAGCKEERDSPLNKGKVMTIPPDGKPAPCIKVTDEIQTKIDEQLAIEAAAKDLIDGMPDCDWYNAGTWAKGCVAQLIYYALFVPVSWVFALSGQFFDKVFEYSLDNASYDIEFVTNGWGVVRDLCNMFFIFVLLYIAIATILDLNHFKTKEMIINVVIIGVLINFSMLATHVMIDASNILARVFYNSDTIKITSKTSNLMFDDSKDGTIPLSMAVVNKFDPQAIVLSGYKHMDIDSYKTKGGTATEVQTTNKNDDVGVGTFIIITLMSTIMSVFGIIMFMSVGLIFVARVIALWFAIIFSPLAFFSYMVPQLSDMKMFGWKNWWPETLKLCFLAPIFMFFLYLIIAFLDQAMSLGDLDSAKGMRWWILITVPFIFIIMLMSKAKEIAKEYSGALGQSITTGLAAAGGLALGGGAAMLALGGRNLIGRGTAALSRQSGDATDKINTQEKLHNESINSWDENQRNHEKLKDGWQKRKEAHEKDPSKKTEFTETEPVATHGAKPDAFKRPEKTGGNMIGDWINRNQKAIGKVDHARSDWDTAMKAAHVPEGTSIDNLSYIQNEAVKKELLKSKKSEIENDITKGIDIDGKITKEDKETYSIRKGKEIRDRDYGGSTDLSKAQEEDLKNKVSSSWNANLKTQVEIRGLDVYAHTLAEAGKEISGAVRALSKANSSSFDLRSASTMKSDKREGFLTKGSTALIAGIALGVRQGMKNSGVDYGKGNKDFMKDIGDIITSSLKNVKIEVPKASGGGHDDHGGGDHGGHH